MLHIIATRLEMRYRSRLAYRFLRATSAPQRLRVEFPITTFHKFSSL